jgi:hypothetical protein
VDDRPPWSDRRRRTLLGLGFCIVGGGLGAVALPARYGISSGFLAALCALLLAGATLVVAVLLLLSTSAELRWLWWLAAAVAAAWTAFAVGKTRRSGG